MRFVHLFLPHKSNDRASSYSFVGMLIMLDVNNTW